jgi:hypothetical protein
MVLVKQNGPATPTASSRETAQSMHHFGTLAPMWYPEKPVFPGIFHLVQGLLGTC